MRWGAGSCGVRTDRVKQRRVLFFLRWCPLYQVKLPSPLCSALLCSAPLCVGCCCINNTLRADHRERERKRMREGGNNGRERNSEGDRGRVQDAWGAKREIERVREGWRDRVDQSDIRCWGARGREGEKIETPKWCTIIEPYMGTVKYEAIWEWERGGTNVRELDIKMYSIAWTLHRGRERDVFACMRWPVLGSTCLASVWRLLTV